MVKVEESGNIEFSKLTKDNFDELPSEWVKTLKKSFDEKDYYKIVKTLAESLVPNKWTEKLSSDTKDKLRIEFNLWSSIYKLEEQIKVASSILKFLK